MKTDLQIDGTMVLTGAAVIAAIGVVYLVKTKGAAAAKVVTEGLNPASQNNVANTTVNRLGEIFTGTPPGGWSLGTALYDGTHVAYDPNDSSTAGEPFSLAKTISTLGEGLSWFSPPAVIAKGVTKATGIGAPSTKNVDPDLGGYNFGVVDSSSWD